MNQKRVAEDLQTIRERQEYILSAEKHLNDMRSHQDRWILFARAAGATWQEIGDALGVSFQAAQQRHARALEQQQAAGATETPE